ncbi:zinc finger protein 135-like [Perca fluviatilis]|uniref:zinc finger protein 135-like n=1 Tax=Perca fluviatilis TaxID=8168 RepID=UPI00196460B2|nr:zinc finger protein 135-like [Perca fluviatilis]
MKRRSTTQSFKPCSISCKDCGLKFTHWDVYKTHLHQHALEEEGEEAQTGDDLNPAAKLDSERTDDGENGGEDTDGDADGCDMGTSLQTQTSGLTQGVEVAPASRKKKPRKGYACLDCGKLYTYLVSFTKHQQLHENQQSSKTTSQNLREYQCPDCGMSFIRRARLLGHLRVHRSLQSKPPRCDQCNKNFSSIKSWLSHVDLHKQKPFWCLSCAKGYKDEASLDKHLHTHNLTRTHTCNICHKSFYLSRHLRNHHNTHTGARPYQCTLCGKSFSHPGNLFAHRSRHFRKYAGSRGIPLGIKNSAIIAKKRVIQKKRLLLASVKEETNMDTNMQELPGKEKCVGKNYTLEPWNDAGSGDRANSEESDCGEPLDHFKLSKSPGWTGSYPLAELKSESRRGQKLDERESKETNLYREHKYWEWECIECDMGFDEVAKLHLHYIKHATGELPIPQDDSEG